MTEEKYDIVAEKAYIFNDRAGRVGSAQHQVRVVDVLDTRRDPYLPCTGRTDPSLRLHKSRVPTADQNEFGHHRSE